MDSNPVLNSVEQFVSFLTNRNLGSETSDQSQLAKKVTSSSFPPSQRIQGSREDLSHTWLICQQLLLEHLPIRREESHQFSNLYKKVCIHTMEE